MKAVLNGELSLCPYCQATPTLTEKGKKNRHWLQNTKSYKYSCPNGHMGTVWWFTEKQAKERWNNRHYQVVRTIKKALAVPPALWAN